MEDLVFNRDKKYFFGFVFVFSIPSTMKIFLQLFKLNFMKKIILLILLSGLSFALRAQTLTPFVVSTSGAFYSNGAGMLSTTIGELAAVTTLSGGSNYLTQGFQQPWDFSVSIPEIQE